jgi:hypothetical protein
MLFKEITPFYFGNHTTQMNTFYAQNSEFMVINAGGTYTRSYHWGLHFEFLLHKHVQIMFKYSVRTSKKTLHLITYINWLTQFMEIIAVYTENRTKPITTKYTFTDR